jgi:hypothetical protein
MVGGRAVVVAILVALAAPLMVRAACKDTAIHARGLHYELCYELSGANAELRKGTSFSSGGQFEVLIPKEKFPVAAPKCGRALILRMPWTDPAARDAAAKVRQKRELYDAIGALKSGARQVDVAIDLAPYVRVLARDPLQVELTGCNIFFAQKSGAYVGAE